jgi:hypothetical protein
MTSFLSAPTTGIAVRRASNVVPRASTTNRTQSTAARPTETKSDSNIKPFFQNNGSDGDALPWVIVAKNFTTRIIESWAASPPSEDEIDAISSQILDAMEAELELEISPSSKQQKESVYGMWADWDRY